MGDPVDELIATVLSQNTTDKNSARAFWLLKKGAGSWDRVCAMPARRLARLIRPAGLANIKAARIKGVLQEIKRREGRMDLSSLRRRGLDEALDYLTSLKGVGPKTAACVLLFSFGKPAMPVDTHIFRVTRRLGLIGERITREKAHSVLREIVPKSLIYDFHLGIIEHGRRTCRARNPRCGRCVLYRLCRFEERVIFRRRGEA